MKYKKFFNDISVDEMINKFIEEHSEEPVLQELNKRKIKECVEAPFSFLRENLKNNKLFVQRHAYLCTFYTTTKRAKSALKDVEKKHKQGKVGEKKYKEVKNMLEDFLKRKDDNN